MKISLIGMSGSGKSFWAHQLETIRFQRFCIDDLIEARLGTELKESGLMGINDVAKWMGEPYEKNYKAHSEQYLALEEMALGEVLDNIKNLPDAKDIVIDTTGSVVYLKPQLLDQLTDLTAIVYLKIPKAAQEMLYQLYLDDPKPVIWGQSFYQRAGETGPQALARCYPALLASRERQYEKLAEFVLPISTVKSYRAEGFASRLAKMLSVHE